MLATAAAQLPVGDDWTYEVKWDGYRTLAVKDGSQIRLLSRNMKDVTAQYPSVAAAARSVSATSAVIDGEVVALDADGRPTFQALHHRQAEVVAFYAFDLLSLNGADLMRQPLVERRGALAKLVAGSSLLLSEPLDGSPDQIEAAVRGLGLEGLVAKRARSLYQPGRRSDQWIKVKFGLRQEFVIGGYKPLDAGFDSVLVGYYDGKRLRYAGKVRAGFAPRTRAALFDAVAPHAADACPFDDLPNARKSHWGEGITAGDMAGLRWVRPRVVVEVAFTEWTRDHHLRHASFVGLRIDKKAREVRREPGPRPREE